MKKKRKPKRGSSRERTTQISRDDESPELLAAIDAGVQSLMAKGVRVTARGDLEATVRRGSAAAHFHGARNPPKPRLTSAMVREILEPSTLTLQAAELGMPLLRPKKITYQHLWTMLDGLWKLRRELHPKSNAVFEDSAGARELKQRGFSQKSIAAVERGLAESAAGDTLYRGSFAKRRKRKRVLFSEFKKLMSEKTVGSTKDDLDAVRGDR